jgi:hypothetical protein
LQKRWVSGSREKVEKGVAKLRERFIFLESPSLSRNESGCFRGTEDTDVTIKTTPNELVVLMAILNSEYQDGSAREDVVGHDIWSSYVADDAGISRRAYSGVVSSLVKKGLVTIGDAGHAVGSDVSKTIALTGDGFDAIPVATKVAS